MERLKNFGNGLYYILDGASFKSRKQVPCVGIYSANCSDYVVAEYGCFTHSLVLVPIYDTLGPNACSYISNQGKTTQFDIKVGKAMVNDR